MLPCIQLTELPAFGELQASAQRLKSASIEALFARESDRAELFQAEATGLQLDYSKQLLDKTTRALLLALASQAELPGRAEELLAGAELNNTEQRPALHTLLRATESTAKLADKFQQVAAMRARMQQWVQRIAAGDQRGFNGQVITDIVNIGIGGSDLGPRLVTSALKAYHSSINCHYVANVDPADIEYTLRDLSPSRTLFIICSKSFRTEETLANSLAARAWLLNAGATEQDLNKHFLAITTNLQAAADFGIETTNCLPMWDWVGGRYSVWSAVGLSCAMAIGWSNFEQFLAGAAAMDTHFISAPVAQNLPMLMSLLEIWSCNCLGAQSHAVLPYDQGLRLLPEYLQQLTMESNGKRVNTDGRALDYRSSPILWGTAGTMGQHSFHQLLHQGTQLCPVDFILPLSSSSEGREQHARLVANCLAQSRAMMVGRSPSDVQSALLARGLSEHEAQHLTPHLVIPGNRPNSIISFEAVTPYSLGALMALYEHRTFCSGQLWGINPFDQWGVELGKEIGADIFQRMKGAEKSHPLDSATENLLSRWRSMNWA